MLLGIKIRSGLFLQLDSPCLVQGDRKRRDMSEKKQVRSVVSVLWLSMLSSVLCDLPPGTRRNAYLPPEPTKGGYTYDKPTVPFPKPTPSYPTGPPRPPTPTPTPTSTPSRPGYPTPGYPSPRPTPPTPRPTPGFPGEHDHGHHEPGMPFDFNYAVKEDAFGNDYSHNAISDGDVTRGEYRVQLPDGRMQIVRYTADWKHGFSAQVSYEGNPRFDIPRPGTGFRGY